MADLFDNPMGLMGFEFVEFASPTPGVLEPVFEALGFRRFSLRGEAKASLEWTLVSVAYNLKRLFHMGAKLQAA